MTLRRSAASVLAGLVTLGTVMFAGASSASASIGYRAIGDYPSDVTCHAAGQAVKHLYGPLYNCTPHQFVPGVYTLWVRVL
ncbi:hypothetical protein ABZ348_13315 [Streptomyces sp. NPDC005963]|uniref:hypothetical protein n=1 Tax=Streptomyces sp. NPDC005963 TaxID=3156721 RepID=UPI0033F6F37F